MPLEYHYDSAMHAVVTTVTGRVDANDTIASLQRVRDDVYVPSGFIDIVDLSLVEDTTIDAADAKDIVSVVSEIRSRKGLTGTAFFAPTELSLGIAQMFQEMLEELGLWVKIYRDWPEMSADITKRLRDNRSTQNVSCS